MKSAGKLLVNMLANVQRKALKMLLDESSPSPPPPFFFSETAAAAKQRAKNVNFLRFFFRERHKRAYFC